MAMAMAMASLESLLGLSDLCCQQIGTSIASVVRVDSCDTCRLDSVDTEHTEDTEHLRARLDQTWTQSEHRSSNLCVIELTVNIADSSGTESVDYNDDGCPPVSPLCPH